jgi:uracil-DNA glycosylase family 4
MKTNFSIFTEDEPGTTSVVAPPQLFVPGRKVFNKQPLITNTPYRIAIVGEFPTKDEFAAGEPFLGQSGKLLTGILTRCRIVREACFLGNVCQYYPSNGTLNSFDWNGPEIQSSIAELMDDLSKFKPNVILCLGSATMHLFMSGNVAPRRTKSGNFKYTHSLSSWRGSIFKSNINSYKCLSSYHPLQIFSKYNWIAYLQQDIIKTLSQSYDPVFIPPVRDLVIDLPCDALCAELDRLNSFTTPISVDIEGYWHNLTCCSIAEFPNRSFIVPFAKLNGESFWNLDEECLVWKSFIRLLENPAVPKIWQNGLYDRFCLQYGYGIVVRCNVDDTMLKFWEWRCEMKKSLAVQASILTTEPYWKHERVGKTEDESITGH